MTRIPDSLIRSLRKVESFNEEAFNEVHESGEQVTSVRVNRFKATDPFQFAIANFKSVKKIPWSDQGFYLLQRPSFTLDPYFHAGYYYVQEASGMFLEEVMRQTLDLGKPLKVLDLCAAPGGKSTLIQSLISSDSLLVSNEVIKSRVSVLEENMTRWGATNLIITNNDPKDFAPLNGFFDLIMIVIFFRR
jgi:16S rRNA C967 or C1407 C5-methylase (RsmB/RsmF family)